MRKQAAAMLLSTVVALSLGGAAVAETTTDENTSGGGSLGETQDPNDISGVNNSDDPATDPLWQVDLVEQDGDNPSQDPAEDTGEGAPEGPTDQNGDNNLNQDPVEQNSTGEGSENSTNQTNQDGQADQTGETSQTDGTEALQDRIDALPDPVELAAMSTDEWQTVYAEVSALYDAIDELPDGAADNLDVARLEAVAEFFSGQIMLLVDGDDEVESPVAQVTHGESCDSEDKVASYASLADAVAAADSGDTVTLLSDTTLETLSITKSLTLDLNGNTITYTSTSGGGIVCSGSDDTVVTIKGGTITGSYSLYAVKATQGTVNLVDCTISAYAYTVYNAGATLNMDNCTVKATSGSGRAVYATAGEVKLTECKISAPTYTVLNAGAALTLNECEVTAESTYAVYATSGTVRLENRCEVSALYYTVYNLGAALTLDDCTVVAAKNSYGYAVYINTSEDIEVTLNKCTITAEEGSSGYAVRTNAGKVTLSKCVILAPKSAVYNTGATLNLDSCTVEAKSSSWGIYNKAGNLTMTGGTVEAKTSYAVRTFAGSVTLSGVSVSSPSFTVYNTGATLNLKDKCTITATTSDKDSGYAVCALTGTSNTIENCTVSAPKYAVYGGNAVLSLKGCTVTASDMGLCVVTGGTVSLEDTTVTATGIAPGDAIVKKPYAVYLGNNADLNTGERTGDKIGFSMDKDSVVTSPYVGVAVLGSGVTLDIYGTVWADAAQAVTTNGTYNDNTISVYEDAEITSAGGPGIYAPSVKSTTNIFGGTISGITGIELRGGNLNIYKGSKITGTGEFSTEENKNGSTVKGAAVAVSQHTTNDNPMVVTITGGELSGTYALYEADLQDSDSKGVELYVRGGDFSGTESALYSMNITGFVTGGMFSDEVVEKYLAEGYVSFQKTADRYSVCNHNADNTDGESPVTGVEAKDPTCTEGGNVAYWHCSKCDTYFLNGDLTMVAMDGTALAAAGHKASRTEAVAPTCTEDGNVAYWSCAKCDTYFSDKDLTQEISLDDTVVAATKHEEASKTEAKAATCTEAGNVEYWYCPACGEYFSDKALTKQIAQADTVLADTAHANAAKVEAKAATETEDGNVTYWHCPDCGKYFSDETLTKEIAQADTVVPATGAAAPAPAEPTEPAPASPATPEPSEPEPETPAADEPSTPAADGAQAEPEAPATDEPAAPATDETGAPSDDGAAAAPAAGSSSSNAAAPSIVQTGDASGTAARAAALLAAVSGAAGALLLSLRRRVLSGKRAE